MCKIGFDLVLETDLSLTGAAHTDAVHVALRLLSLDVDTFDRGHGKEEVFDQERFLDVHWEVSQVLWSFFHPPRRLRILHKAGVLRCDVVVVEVGSFEEPVWQLGNRRFDNFEDTGRRDFGTVC